LKVALSLEEERQPKIWKSRVTNGEERLIATMSGTLFALSKKGGSTWKFVTRRSSSGISEKFTSAEIRPLRAVALDSNNP
jgi:hypothetical protein